MNKTQYNQKIELINAIIEKEIKDRKKIILQEIKKIKILKHILRSNQNEQTT